MTKKPAYAALAGVAARANIDLPRTGFVGPWAMLDVFVMSVLVALVKLGEMTPCCLARAASPSGVFRCADTALPW